MAPVEMYSIEYCPFCDAARNLLDRKGVSYVDHDLSPLREVEWRAKLRDLCGRTTVPQIWIGDRYVGGCTDLQALDRSGELDRLIAG